MAIFQNKPLSGLIRENGKLFSYKRYNYHKYIFVYNHFKYLIYVDGLVDRHLPTIQIDSDSISVSFRENSISDGLSEDWITNR